MYDLYKTIESLCKIKGINITTMCKESGASRGSLTDLKNKRKKSLSADTLSRIADYFGVTVDFLLGKELPWDAAAMELGVFINQDAGHHVKKDLSAKSDEVTFDDFTYALHNQSKELNDANKEKLLDMARMLKLAQDAQKNK